jgi:hypothetical protein
LPTPTANRYGSTNNGSPHDGRKEYATKGTPSLDTMATRGTWPTPTVKGNYANANRGTKEGDGFATAVARFQPGPLNPAWVELLMGFPIEWTNLRTAQVVLFK